MEYTYWVLEHRVAEGEWEQVGEPFDSLADVKEAYDQAPDHTDYELRNLTILEVTVTKRTIVP